MFQIPLIEPEGPLRESLSSLLIRTARVNDVSPSQLLERKFHRQGPNGSIGFTSRALGSTVGQSINGHGSIGAAFAQRTEKITGLVNLAASTAKGFAKFTTPNGLFHDRFVWSPDYLREVDSAYHPLLWMLEPVRVCPLTRKPLVSACPHCRKRIAIYPGSGYIERCCHCGSPFTERTRQGCRSDPIANQIKDIDYEVWIAEQLGDCIAGYAQCIALCRTSFSDCLKHWMDIFELRTAKAASKVLGASDNAISNWLIKGSSPRLRMTLNLCWVMGLDMRQFLSKKMPANHRGDLRPSREPHARHAVTSRRRPIDRKKMESELKLILKNDRYPMLSFREICEAKLNRREVIVREYFPDLSKQIAQRNVANRRIRARVEQKKVCAEIVEYSRILHEQGTTPNYKNLYPYMETPTKLRSDWAIEALRKIRVELGYECGDEQLVLPL